MRDQGTLFRRRSSAAGGAPGYTMEDAPAQQTAHDAPSTEKPAEIKAPGADDVIRETLAESNDDFPVRAVNVDAAVVDDVDTVKGSDPEDEVIVCYSHPTAKVYSSYWRKRLLGLDDWTLVNYDALPKWLQDNDYIITGNRPPLSWRQVFQSLLYLHNQTGNIYSHLLCGFAMTALMVYTYVGMLGPEPGVSALEYTAWTVFFIGASWVLYVSAGFHLTMCHSQKTAFIGGCCDYTGIVLMIYCSSFLAITYAFDCKRLFMNIYISFFSALAVACAVSMYVPVMNTPKMRPWRSLLFVLFGLFGGLPMVHFVIGAGWQRSLDLGVGWILLEGVVYILGAFLFAMRFPERLAPGRFDYWGHSHQFHHLCSGMGGFIHWYGMKCAFDYTHKYGCLY